MSLIKDLNDTILICLDSFRPFRGPTFHKTETSQDIFFEETLAIHCYLWFWLIKIRFLLNEISQVHFRYHGGGNLNDDRKPWIDVIQFAIKELKEGKDEERKGCWMTAVKSLQLMIIVVASWMVGLLCSLSNTTKETSSLKVSFP